MKNTKFTVILLVLVVLAMLTSACGEVYQPGEYPGVTGCCVYCDVLGWASTVFGGSGCACAVLGLSLEK